MQELITLLAHEPPRTRNRLRRRYGCHMENLESLEETWRNCFQSQNFAGRRVFRVRFTTRFSGEGKALYRHVSEGAC
jgi:hypothetical protein